MRQEIWKDITGFEGYYQISNLGRVKSLKRPYVKADRILTPTFDSDGYLMVCFCKNRIQTTPKIHRLIADAFILNPNKKECINHINGIKTDNSIENLEWCSHQENITHAFKTGLRNSTGEKNCKAKLKESDILEIRAIKEKSTVLAELYNVSESTILRVKSRKMWAHV